ncbi:TetR-like C-terminal domain-containing protein [Streptosporangium lutulentum]
MGQRGGACRRRTGPGRRRALADSRHRHRRRRPARAHPPGGDRLRRSRRRPIATAFVSASVRNPATARALHAFYAARHRQSAVLITRAIERGELPEGTDAVEVVRVAVAPLYYRLFITGERPTRRSPTGPPPRPWPPLAPECSSPRRDRSRALPRTPVHGAPGPLPLAGEQANREQANRRHRTRPLTGGAHSTRRARGKAPGPGTAPSASRPWHTRSSFRCAP